MIFSCTLRIVGPRGLIRDTVRPIMSEAVLFADAMKVRTAAQHHRAERTGVVHEMLTGRATRGAYVLYLRSLFPAYRALEHGLEEQRTRSGSDGVGALHSPALLRAPALARDLAALVGADWPGVLPLLPEAEHYARRVAEVAQGDGTGLVAHAYVRYLGDLAGGRVLARRVAETLGLGPSALSFYAFPEIDDVPVFASRFRAELDRLGAELPSRHAVIEEAAVAFDLNIELSQAVARAG